MSWFTLTTPPHTNNSIPMHLGFSQDPTLIWSANGPKKKKKTWAGNKQIYFSYLLSQRSTPWPIPYLCSISPISHQFLQYYFITIVPRFPQPPIIMCHSNQLHFDQFIKTKIITSRPNPPQNLLNPLSINSNIIHHDVFVYLYVFYIITKIHMTWLYLYYVKIALYFFIPSQHNNRFFPLHTKKKHPHAPQHFLFYNKPHPLPLRLV